MGAQRRELPYTTLAAALPCTAGWLVLPGRLQAVTVVVEEPFTFRHLADVIDHRPAFQAVALGAPIGFPDVPVPGGLRRCDVEARALLGWPRRAAVPGTPSRRTLQDPPSSPHPDDPWLTPLAARSLVHWREIDREVQAFHQRSIYSAHPELSFLLLNGEVPLRTSPFTEEGAAERLALVLGKLPGFDMLLGGARPRGVTHKQLLDAGALLWTARRIAGRVVHRSPVDAEWTASGLRMELVR